MEFFEAVDSPLLVHGFFPPFSVIPHTSTLHVHDCGIIVWNTIKCFFQYFIQGFPRGAVSPVLFCVCFSYLSFCDTFLKMIIFRPL